MIERKTRQGKPYFLNRIYPIYPPKVDDFYIITRSGDRLDTLALEFYNNPLHYWVIVATNNLPSDTFYLPVGIQLRILGDLNDYLDVVDSVNE